MKCSHCHFQNPAGMKFCGNCGTKLQVICSSCQFENPPDFKFCGSCGSSIASSLEERQPANPVRTPRPRKLESGQRRQLTVMFCDVVGSTELSHRLDPEDLRTIIKEYQGVCERIISRFDGHIAQFLGDGIMAYFGFPKAHENDAHRAVSSALGIIEGMAKFNAELIKRFNLAIHVRIGIHTGNVVIDQMGEGLQAQELAMGPAPNVAARLEGEAQPDNVVISQATYDLVRKYFNCEDLGTRNLKGVNEPVRIYTINSANVAKYRYAQLASYDSKPLLGRDDELMQIRALWELAADARGQIVALKAEPGLGKSTLVDAAMRISTEDSDAWMMYHQCSEYHINTSFYPIAQAMLNAALKIKPNDTIPERIARLEGFMLQIGYDLNEMLPLFAQILSIPLTGSQYAPTPYSLTQQRQKLVEAVIHNFLQRSRDNRLLLIFEDLQWMDSATLEIVNGIIHASKDHRILVVLTYRPEFKPGWDATPRLKSITLRHLGKNSSRELISHIAQGKAVPEALIEQIIRKTDGIPLFVEELTKTILNSNLVVETQNEYRLDKPLSEITIPSTLHASLEARLDRMSHTKDVAQFGAAIGREFDYRLIVDACPMQEDSIRMCLSELVEAELLTQKGMPPEATYQFRHALIMDAAYASLLKSNRVIIHQRIARSMEKFETYIDQAPETVAHQFNLSKQYEKALTYWSKAAQKARIYQSLEEALIFIDKAMAMLPSVTSDKKVKLEAELLSMKAPTHQALESYGSSNAYTASLRLYELANRLDDEQARFNALKAMITYEVFSGQPDIAVENAKRAAELATKIATDHARIEAQRLLGQASMYVGAYSEALESLDGAYMKFKALGDNVDPILTNQGIFSLSQSSHCMWYLGFPDQALERGRRAVELAEDHGAIHTLSMAYFLHCLNCVYVGRWDETIEIADKGLKLTEEYGMRMFHSEIRFLRGMAHAATGEVDRGIELMHTSLTWRISVGLFSASHLQTSMLAEVLIKEGRLIQARAVLNHSERLISSNKDQLFRSEFYRVNALLLSSTNGPSQESQELFKHSLKIATEQNTPSFELRTLMSMLEVSSNQEDGKSILAQLQQTFDSFDEGHSSHDLQHADYLINKYSDIPHASLS